MQKCQNYLTLDEIIVDMKGGHFNAGQAYVAFSRVKTLECLHILNFNPTAIKKSDMVADEMLRLSTKLLPPVPEMQCLSLHDGYIAIALLNVRCLTAKLLDIEKMLFLDVQVYSVSVRHGSAPPSYLQ